MKAAIFGVGRMGQAIGYAMDKLGYDLVVFEPVRESVRALEAHIDKSVRSYEHIVDHHELRNIKPDIVISSLPYNQTKKVALMCINSGIRYCDLGGRVDVSAEINKLADTNATAPVFTDLGLAPGWVNILAEQGYKRVYDATNVKMMVGGIPLHRPKGPLGYLMTWSLEGLINEYQDDCEILENGIIRNVSGLSRLEIVDPEWEGCVALEAFCTSGGAAHTTKLMHNRGVKDCVYKTLRWVGHHHLVDFFMNKCKMNNDQLADIFTQSAKYENSREDIVIIMAQVRNNSGLSWNKEIVVECDGKFTAMQRGTAFPISSIASMMAQGLFDNRKDERRGYYLNLSNRLTYSDVPFDQFNKQLDVLLNK